MRLVARVWCNSVFLKYLLLESGAFLSSQSACGSSLAHFCLVKVAVAQVWRISVFSKCLWLESGAFLSFQSACGSSLAHFCLFEVPAARVWRGTGRYFSGNTRPRQKSPSFLRRFFTFQAFSSASALPHRRG